MYSKKSSLNEIKENLLGESAELE